MLLRIHNGHTPGTISTSDLCGYVTFNMTYSTYLCHLPQAPVMYKKHCDNLLNDSVVMLSFQLPFYVFLFYIISFFSLVCPFSIFWVNIELK